MGLKSLDSDSFISHNGHEDSIFQSPPSIKTDDYQEAEKINLVTFKK